MTTADAVAVPRSRRNLTLVLIGSGVGLAYGFGLRLLVGQLSANQIIAVMTFGFIVLMPVALGFMSIYLAEIGQKQKLWVWLILPWLPMAGVIAGTMLVLLEGAICVVMFAPLALVLASLGGVIGGLAGRFIRQREV